MLIMREVLTVIGPTPDQENRSPSLPLAVREWCINTAAVNPATKSVFAPSEDGHGGGGCADDAEQRKSDQRVRRVIAVIATLRSHQSTVYSLQSSLILTDD